MMIIIIIIINNNIRNGLVHLFVRLSSVAKMCVKSDSLKTKHSRVMVSIGLFKEPIIGL